MGVTLYYVGYTNYTSTTRAESSSVGKFERQLIRYCKHNELLMPERGGERVRLGLEELMTHIQKMTESGVDLSESPTIVRRSPRFSEPGTYILDNDDEEDDEDDDEEEDEDDHHDHDEEVPASSIMQRPFIQDDHHDSSGLRELAAPAQEWLKRMYLHRV